MINKVLKFDNLDGPSHFITPFSTSPTPRLLYMMSQFQVFLLGLYHFHLSMDVVSILTSTCL